MDIVGNLCTSADHLGSGVSAPVLEVGDLVVADKDFHHHKARRASDIFVGNSAFFYGNPSE